MPKPQTWAPLYAILVVAAACGGSDDSAPPDGIAPLGDLEVRWTLNNAAGQALTCEDVGVENVEVAIGGTPKTVPCKDGVTLFEKLLAQKYPVVVRLKYGPVDLAIGLGNVEVETGKLATISIPLEVEQRNVDVGSIRLKWRIDDQAAAARCGEIGALTFRVTAEIGSIDELLTADAACVAGELLINDVKPGSYDLRVKLEAPDGSNIVSALTGTFRVVPAGIADLGLINFTTVLTGGGKIRGLYTINSSVAADACDMVNGAEVKMTVRSIDQNTQSTRLEGTQTASCAEGSLHQKRLGTNLYSVQFDLMDSFGFALSSTTVRDIQVEYGETSTISVDFKP